MALASNHASRPASALPPGKGRDTTALSPAGKYVSDQPRPAWQDMPGNTPEERKARTRASQLWNCDEWHQQGRTDLARSHSDAFKLNWQPTVTPRHTPQTVALPFFDKAEPLGPKGKLETAPESVPESAPETLAMDMNGPAYDPFVETAGKAIATLGEEPQ